VTASHARLLLSLRKTQKAVAPPPLLQIVPPVTVCEVQVSPWGLKVIGEVVVLPSPGVSAEPAGRNCDFRFAVLGAFATGCGATSELIAFSGSPLAADVPPFPEAPVALCG